MRESGSSLALVGADSAACYNAGIDQSYPASGRQSIAVCLLNYYYNPKAPDGESLLKRYHTLQGWAEGLRDTGLRTSVFQRFQRDEAYQSRGIQYQFVNDHLPAQLKLWQVPIRLHRMLKTACEQYLAQGHVPVIHLNGLLFPIQTRHLRATLPSRCVLVLQHHAEKPMPGWRGILQRWGLAAVDGFLFAALDLAQPWLERGVIRHTQDIFEVMEGSTYFTWQERPISRSQTGMHGNPLFLWVGRLNTNKDPLVVLGGFEKFLQHYPTARLYMIYHTQELLPQIQAKLSTNPTLDNAVTLLGQVPHDRMPLYYNSADYFILGSHVEGSGYALIEALACGVVPVVTDIPSFRKITGEGCLGALWRVGDVDACFSAILAVLSRPPAEQSKAARRFFDDHLSYPAIGSQARLVYETLARRRSQRGV